MNSTRSLALTLLLLGLFPNAQARVVRIQISRTESPTFGGASFGSAGQYEKLVGRAFGEVDPLDPRNAVITDIALAPRNARGIVEYATDIYILKPVDLAKGNHRVFFEHNNRGVGLALGQMNDATSGGNDPSAAADAGNGFLMRQGYTLVWCGWDGQATAGAGRFTITLPVAKKADGSSITGRSLDEFVIDNDTTVTGALTYAAASGDKTQATLTVRTRYEDAPVAVPSTGWEYANAALTSIRLLPAGTAFQRGTLYEFAYTAKDPLVMGLGFAAVRDVAEFLRRAKADDTGIANPLAGDVRFAYTYCFSQPCRMMHDFLALGFNQDNGGQQVFDAILNWVGGGSGIFMNYRFGQTGRTHRQHIGRWYPEFEFPFANQILTDPATGKTDGRLRRCMGSATCPKIMEVNSENEYWSKAMSGLHVDPSGKDLADPWNVRYYLMASLPHSAGTGPTGPGICQQERNPLVANTVLRALLTDLDEWVTSGKEPPESRMPRVADATLVPPLPQAGMGFPNISGVIYNSRTHTGDLFDFGLLASQGILDTLPPVLKGTPYPTMVPKTDTDGNDIAGIRIPEIAAPLATYTGWALRAFPTGANDGCDAAGQKIEFAKTKAERIAKNDPRLSLEERYPNPGDYLAAVTSAANRLQEQRLLVPEDRDAYIDGARRSTVIAVKTLAVAGPRDATVLTRQFQLNGSASVSFDGKPLTYRWDMGPGSPSASILGGDTATPTVQFGTSRGTYTFQLTVTDSAGNSATDFVTVQYFGI